MMLGAKPTKPDGRDLQPSTLGLIWLRVDGPREPRNLRASADNSSRRAGSIAMQYSAYSYRRLAGRACQNLNSRDIPANIGDKFTNDSNNGSSNASPHRHRPQMLGLLPVDSRMTMRKWRQVGLSVSPSIAGQAPGQRGVITRYIATATRNRSACMSAFSFDQAGAAKEGSQSFCESDLEMGTRAGVYLMQRHRDYLCASSADLSSYEPFLKNKLTRSTHRLRSIEFCAEQVKYSMAAGVT